jgi:hypothetical protein
VAAQRIRTQQIYQQWLKDFIHSTINATARSNFNIIGGDRRTSTVPPACIRPLDMLARHGS